MPLGSTLKAIRDQTHVKIDIPRRDTGSSLTVPGTNGYGSSHVSSRSASPLPSPQAEDEENEPTVTITIEGAAPMAQEAQLMIQHIITEKTSRTSQKVKDIPAQVYPFALLRKTDFLRVSEGREINLTKDDKERSITVSGDREAVGKVVETIKSCIAFYEGDLSMVKISLPKKQHHLLAGGGADEILNKAKCAVIVPAITDSSEDVFVWGKSKDLGPGLQAVMEVRRFPEIRSSVLISVYSARLRHIPPLCRSMAPTLAKSSHTSTSLVTSRTSDSRTLMSKSTFLLSQLLALSPSTLVVPRLRSIRPRRNLHSS